MRMFYRRSRVHITKNLHRMADAVGPRAGSVPKSLIPVKGHLYVGWPYVLLNIEPTPKPSGRFIAFPEQQLAAESFQAAWPMLLGASP
jgi:hypothetical protein